MNDIETGRETLRVGDGTEMAAYRARPKGAAKAPGLLLLQEAFGVNAWIRAVAERFAREGWSVLAPELFHRTAPGFEGSYGDFAAVQPHLQALTADGMAADLRAAHARLEQSGSAGDVCAVGFCMGGRAAFLADAVLPLKAAVSFYGAGIAPALLDRAPSLSGPILLIWGGRDKHIPPETTAAVSAALRAAGKSFAAAEFSDGDHGFFCDARPTYHAPSAVRAWALTLAFLKTRGG
ncbi:MAG: dienelactone hydrolase family protein [Elusimicrobia bacterium]|nr:dienelactone hydrolase family protein [Elusimicrobiota bacterium]